MTDPSCGSANSGKSRSGPLGQRYWNVNVPETDWTEDCPDFLRDESERTIGRLATEDKDYHVLSWSEVKQIIEDNRIDVFQRLPSDFRRYCHYVFELKNKYGSILSFIQSERLHWPDVTPASVEPFTDASDYTILYNDWPYGIDKDITHLVVWTKFGFEDDPQTGDLTPSGRKLIENFVQERFCAEGGVDRSDLMWFKNWASLKSVHALEHFHIMLYRAPAEFLETITNGDRPLCESFTG